MEHEQEQEQEQVQQVQQAQSVHAEEEEDTNEEGRVTSSSSALAASGEPVEAAADDSNRNSNDHDSNAGAVPAEGEPMLTEEQLDEVWPDVQRNIEAMLEADPAGIKLKNLRHELSVRHGKRIIKQLMGRIRNYALDYVSRLTAADVDANAGPDEEHAATSGTDDASVERSEHDHDQEDDQERASSHQRKRKRLRKNRSADSDDEQDRVDQDGSDDGAEDPADEHESDRANESDFSEDDSSRHRRIPKKSTARAKERVRVPGAPTRPRSAYILFSAKQRAKLRRDEPDLSFTELTKTVADKWRDLSAEEKEQYTEASRNDRERWEKEMEQFKETDPEGYEREIQAFGKRKKAPASERPKKIRKKVRAESNDDGGNALIDDDDQEPKPLSRWEEIVQAAKSSGSRSKKVQVDEEELAVEGQSLINRMKSAALRDEDMMLEDKPAVAKFNLLPEVITALTNKFLCSKMLELRVLRVVKEWLDVNPDDSLPNVQLRSALYRALDTMEISVENLKNSNGLGKMLMARSKHPDESTENKRLLTSIVLKWFQMMRGGAEADSSTNVGRRQAEEITMRRQAIADMTARAMRHSAFPQAAVFDYAIRPESEVTTRDDDEEEGKGRGGNSSKNNVNSLWKTLDRMKRASGAAARR